MMCIPFIKSSFQLLNGNLSWTQCLMALIITGIESGSCGMLTQRENSHAKLHLNLSLQWVEIPLQDMWLPRNPQNQLMLLPGDLLWMIPARMWVIRERFPIERENRERKWYLLTAETMKWFLHELKIFLISLLAFRHQLEPKKSPAFLLLDVAPENINQN